MTDGKHAEWVKWVEEPDGSSYDVWRGYCPGGQAMTATIKLAGRVFTGVTQSISSNQYDYIQAHVRRAGAVEILTELDGIERTQEKRAEDLLTQILLRGEKAPILAGCLTEEGKVWNRAEADRNAARFEAITDPAEITEMNVRIVEFVINFFSLGPASLETPTH